MNPLRYSLSEISKALVALVGLVGYVLSIYLTIDPGLITSLELLVPAVVAVIAVFAAKNQTPDDLQKTVFGLVAAAVTVVTYLDRAHVDKWNKLLTAIGSAVVMFGVYWFRNKSPGAAQ